MQVNVFPHRISRQVVKAIGVLFILVVLAYASTSPTAFTSRVLSDDVVVYSCPSGYTLINGNQCQSKSSPGNIIPADPTTITVANG